MNRKKKKETSRNWERKKNETVEKLKGKEKEKKSETERTREGVKKKREKKN